MLFKLLDFCCCVTADVLVRIIVPFSRFCQWRAKKRINVRRKKNILIYSCDLLGDNMIRLPFFLALRERFPREQYHISAVFTRSIGAFLGKLDIFDEIVVDDILNDRHPIFWLFERMRFACGAIRWAFHNKVDILIWTLTIRSLGCDFIQRLSSPRMSITYSSNDTQLMFPVAAHVQRIFYDRKYDLLMSSRMGSCLLDDLNVMYQRLINTNEQLNVGRTGKYLRRHLEEIHIKELPQNYIVLVPGAGVSARQWPPERFAQLADRLGEKFVIVGSGQEKPLGEKIIAMSKSDAKFINLCGETSLEQLGTVLAKSSLVVTNETGTATYAAMIGTPTVCVLGGGYFGTFFPNPHYPNTRSVYHKESCFYCRWQCTKDYGQNTVAPCIDSITVDDVYAQVKELLRTERA